MKKRLHTPEGVRDIYGKECKVKRIVVEKLRDTFASFGYDEIETPGFEFYDIYGKDIGTNPGRELYRFFDREGNTLALRPDFTPGVMRCVASHFASEELPVRLTYCGNAYSNVTSLQGKFHEVTQMGAEMIGDGSAAADAEIIHLIIKNLQNAGLEEFQISLGNADYFRGMCESAKLDEDAELELREFISGKNYFGAEALLKELNVKQKVIDNFLKVVELFGNEEILEESKKLTDNDKSLAAIDRLKEIYEILKIYGDEAYISFDMGLVSRYNYYTGMIVKAYTYGVGDCIATGGRYDNLLSYFGRKAPSVGFVLFTDEIINALAVKDALPETEPDTIFLLYDEDALDKAIRYADELRQLGNKALLIKKEDDKDKKFYTAYAKEKGALELSQITTKGKNQLYRYEK